MNNTVFTTADAAKFQEMVARAEIYDCLVRICRGSDRFDEALFLSAFHPDAITDVGENTCSPAELYAWSVQVGGASISQHHNLLNHSCEVNGDLAHAETYYFFISKVSEEKNWVVGGRYVDRFDRRDGEWKIALRYNLMEWSGFMPALPLPFGEVSDLHANGSPARNKEDPSYRRPLTNRRQMHSPRN